MNLQKLHQPRTFVSLSIATIVFFALASLNSYAQAKSLSTNDDCVELRSIISLGDRGSDVLKLQNFLIDYEYLAGNATGIFDAKTRVALKLFQEEEGITHTGATNIDTQNRIQIVSCKGNEPEESTQNTNTISDSSSSDSSTSVVSTTDTASEEPVRCAGGTVTWLDDTSITMMRNSSPVIVSCNASLPTGVEGRTLTIDAQNGGQSTSNYWVSGYGQASFTCVKENGEYKWKTGAGMKNCSLQQTTAPIKPVTIHTDPVTTGEQTSAANTPTGNTTTTCSAPSKNLELGDGAENHKATEVTNLQRFLIDRGYLVYTSGPTGYFGSITVEAVKKFQLASGITQTGSVFEITRAKIQSLCAARPSSSSQGTSGTASSPSESTGGSTSGTTGKPAATGYSCYKDDLYSNGSLFASCPKAPNGGIACLASKGALGCAGEGSVWINGLAVVWKGNTSKACYAHSACESGYECKSGSSSSVKKCSPKTQFSNETGVTGPTDTTGAQYSRTWSGSTWSTWKFVKCLPGYHEKGSKKCESDTRVCTTSQGLEGTQTYRSSGTWAACQPKTDYNGTPACPDGKHYVEAQGCISSTRSCSAWNGSPTAFPRGTDVATAKQTYNQVTGWGLCEITCLSGYTKETVAAETLGLESIALDSNTNTSAVYYCAKKIVYTPFASAVVTYTSSTGNISSAGTPKSGSESCIIPAGGSSCDVTATWTTSNAQSLTYRKKGTATDLSKSLNGSYKIVNQKPSTTATYILTLMPGSVTYSKTISARCTSGTTWDGSKCTAS